MKRRRQWCHCIHLLLIVFGLVWVTRAHALDPDKITVCSATINSPDEIQMFKKHLNTKEFQYVELMDYSENKANEWFDKACEAKVECDILLVSGHFSASGFFRETNENAQSSPEALDLEVLEKHRCAKDCDGILSRPQEVFLMGCNTLATKDKDSRSPEQYIRDLMGDGFSRLDAEREAEFRYGEVGASSQGRMQAVFQGVPHLYGFHAKGPSGRNVRSFLDNYFRKKPNYAAYLEKEALERTVRGAITVNQAISESMKLTYFSQCAGLPNDDETHEALRKNCILADKNWPLEDRLNIATSMLSHSKWMTYWPQLDSFFNSITPAQLTGNEKAAYEKILSTPEIRHKMKELLAKLRSPELRLNWSESIQKIGWITQQERFSYLKETARPLLKSPLTEENVDILCSNNFGKSNEMGLSLADLTDEHFATERGLKALGCLHVASTALDVRKRLADQFLKWNPKKSKISDFLLSNIATSSNEVRTNSPELDREIARKVMDLFKSNQRESLNGWGWSILMGVAYAATPEVEQWLVAQALGESAPFGRLGHMMPTLRPENIQRLETLALGSTPDSDAASENLISLREYKPDQEMTRKLLATLTEHPQSESGVFYLLTRSSSLSDHDRDQLSQLLLQPVFKNDWLVLSLLEKAESLSPLAIQNVMVFSQKTNSADGMAGLSAHAEVLQKILSRPSRAKEEP